MHFPEKQWKLWENIEILNSPQQKEEENYGVGTKLSYCKVFFKTETEVLKNKPVYLELWLLEFSKILMHGLKWWKSNILLYGYR